MKKRILGTAFAATMIFGTFLSFTEIKAQGQDREFDEGTEPTHMINPNDPYDCSKEFAWDCRP